MKRAVAVVFAILLTACSSAMDDNPPERRGGYGGGERVRDSGALMGEGTRDAFPPSEFWRDPQLSSALRLSTDQYNQLDAIAHDPANDLQALRRESTAATRDLTLLLAADNPTRDDILAAGKRVRDARDAVVERNVRILAAERVILTKSQWDALQSELQSTRDNTTRGGRGNRGGGNFGGRGRRGGMGGGGIWP
jgi:hypothetical protein